MIVQVSKCTMNSKIYASLLKLLREFNSQEELTALEFLEERLTSDCAAIEEPVIEYFVSLINHKKFLNSVKDNLVAHYSIRNHNEEKIIVLLFFVVFVCSVEKADENLELFKAIKCPIRRDVLQYFRDENNLIATALTACKIFEDEYVLKNIIHPLLNKQDLFQRFLDALEEEQAKKYARKPPTIPLQMRVLRRSKSIPTVPINTPVEFATFQARKPPKSLYSGDEIKNKLIGEFEKNKSKAQKLLQQAKSLSANYCKEKIEKQPEETAVPVFKAKKAPSKTNVEIRDNIATVLREANMCIKEQEREIKNIDEILKGGADWKKYQELEENARKLEYEEHIQDVERKHLEGLLTFEEAILAKKKLLESNKEKFKRFMEERDIFINKLELWKEQENEKIRLSVKKGQEIERKAKESEKKLKEERKDRVSRLKDEARRLREKFYEQQKEELEKKVRLIQDIKSLHQLRMMNQIRDDVNAKEPPKFGLLCQMSIAELQQKLAEMKIAMKRQLEQKRRCILMRKEKQKRMIENVKNFIAQARMSKPKVVPNRTLDLARSPDLDKLRRQLEYVRELRKSKA